MAISPQRAARIREVVAKRQLDWTIIIENIYDTRNLAAVLRSADAVGIQHIFVLQTEKALQYDQLELGQKAAGGSLKWLQVHYYREREKCFQHLRQLVDKVYGTHLGQAAIPLPQMDFTQRIGLLFGNERDGISPETLTYLDGNFHLPMFGMTQSLNLSVACAVTLYEGLRQRLRNGQYENAFPNWSTARQALEAHYLAQGEQNAWAPIYPAD